jgi:hypothetical protein
MRYSLPCKHLLIDCFTDERAIPITLVHPRWWLKGPVIRSHRDLIESTHKTTVYSALHTVIQARDRLRDEELSRYDQQVIRMPQNLQGVAHRHEQLAAIPVGQPDAVPKKTWKKKKNTLNTRGLTGNEIAIAEARQMARQAVRQTKDKAILQDRHNETQMSNWSTIEVTDRQYDSTHDSDKSNDTKSIEFDEEEVISNPFNLLDPELPAPDSSQPTAARVPTTSPIPPPPPSTAPPVLGRGKRQRTRTMRKEEAVEAGLVPDSQGALPQGKKSRQI